MRDIYLRDIYQRHIFLNENKKKLQIYAIVWCESLCSKDAISSNVRVTMRREFQIAKSLAFAPFCEGETTQCHDVVIGDVRPAVADARRRYLRSRRVI